MLNSILIKYDAIYSVLDERQKNRKYRDCLNLIECLPKSTLQKVVEFLRPFKVWTDLLEGDKSFTLHRVWPIHSKIMDHLRTTNETDEEIMKSKNFRMIEAMKCFGRVYIEKTLKDDFIPTMKHNIAVALHPRMKKMQKINVETRESTYTEINKIISIDDTTSTIVTRKEKKHSLNLFDDFADTDDEEGTASSFQNKYCKELEDYLRLPSPDDAEFCQDDDSVALSGWWLKRREQFPNLFKLFVRNIIIPASSASSERSFSITGLIISEIRSCISLENVSNIMMCRNLYV